MKVRRFSILCASLSVLLLPATSAIAEPPWETVVRDRERIVEIDRSSVMQSDGGSKVAWGRIMLSPERAAIEGYAWVKALNRYDCYNRSFFTIKRVYVDARNVVIREEGSLEESPVLAARNSVDERMWQEVCRPPSVSDLQKVAREVKAIADAASGEGGEGAPLVPLTRATAATADVPEKETARIGHKMPAATRATPVPPAAAFPQSGRASSKTRKPGADGRAQPDWSYDGETGPQHWGRLRPEWALCAEGRRQSPIDLRNGVAVDLEAPHFDYRETRVRIADTGRTLRVHVGPGMSVELRGQRYQLEFFEFHRPSVERVGGQASPMVVHFYHLDGAGHIAAVAVLLEEGETPHPVIQTLWNNLPLERGTDYAPPAAIDLAALLPGSSAHYLFMGSLETPPCTEGVLWAVMKEPLRVSGEQLAVFARLYARNGRPIQPPNGRLILESR